MHDTNLNIFSLLSPYVTTFVAFICIPLELIYAPIGLYEEIELYFAHYSTLGFVLKIVSDEFVHSCLPYPS